MCNSWALMTNNLKDRGKFNLKTGSIAIMTMFLILPFMVLLPGLIWKSQQLFLIIMLLPIVVLSIKNIWIKTFFLYAFCWQLYLLWSNFAMPSAQTGQSLTETTFFIVAAVLYKFVSESKIEKETWFNIIRISVLIQMAIAISQYLGFNPVTAVMGLFVQARELMPGHFVGTLGNKDFLTAFIAISLPLFIGWKTIIFPLIIGWKRIGWIINKPFGLDYVYPWNLTVVIPLFMWWRKIPTRITNFIKFSDRTPWELSLNIPFLAICFILFFGPTPATLAALIGMAIYINRGWKFIALALLAGFAMCYYYIVIQGIHLVEFQRLPKQLSELWNTGTTFVQSTPDGDLGRFGMWLVALGKLVSSWVRFIFGFGPSADWGKVYPLHSEYMTVFFEFGLIGLTLLLGYIFTTARYLIKSKSVLLGSCFAIACLDITGTYNLHIAPIAFLIIIICGLIERERNAKLLNI
jgi:uncharacterized protein YjeT (DUF2065 family)